jgi:hypothetical protein
MPSVCLFRYLRGDKNENAEKTYRRGRDETWSGASDELRVYFVEVQ